MKQLFLFTALVVLFSSCKKSALDSINETLPAGTVLAIGSFVSNAHATTGTVKINRDVSGKTFLVFENFKTDNGPDLRVWLSPATTPASYQEVGLLKAVNGNFSYELDAAKNYTVNNRVLIWCQDFSILFGHAVLQ